jgi:hypothetical protein
LLLPVKIRRILMKKILVLLLILAVAGGVFALDGEWQLSGMAEVGGTLDFQLNDDDVLIAQGEGYNRVYGGWGGINGRLGLNYLWDAVKIGVEFNTWDGDAIGGNLEYNGESFKFQAATNLAQLISGNWGIWLGDGETDISGGFDDAWGVWYNRMNVGRLWGSYSMLGGLVQLEAAFNSRDNEWWTADKTAAFNSVLGFNDGGTAITGLAGIAMEPWAGGDTFTKVDHHNFLLSSVELENLSFGVMIPNVFAWGGSDLIEDVLKNMVAGFSFDMQPVKVAAQFQMGNYGVYFGLVWSFGVIDTGLSFTGIFKPQLGGVEDLIDVKLFKFGGSVEYKSDAFGVKVGGYYAMDTIALKPAVASAVGYSADARITQIGIEPSFWYNVIPTHLTFDVKVGFYLNGGKVGSTKADTEVGWAVEPQLFWNFLGTGATNNYWGLGTGMIVRYRLVGGDKYETMDDNNKLDVTFKWSF